jgi:hypothetical protein
MYLAICENVCGWLWMRELYKVGERLKRRLATLEQEMDTYARLDWEEKVKGYVTDLQAGIAELNKAIPKTPEEQYRVFLMKKQLVDELVAEAMIDGKRDIQECGMIVYEKIPIPIHDHSTI